MLRDALFLVGAGLAFAGVAMIYLPVALIVAGLCAAAFALLAEWRNR